MKICKVNSLPLKEVIKSLADCFSVDYSENCGEYFLSVPPDLGKGQIRGVNFNNGLGIIIYQCEFLRDVRIDFTVDDVHPVKYIYTVKGPIEHRFGNEDIVHRIEQYKCAIVASKSKNGHILFFQKNTSFEVVSLEIDRSKFLKSADCEINDVAGDLKKLYQDVKAKDVFYHEGFYGLEFKNLLSNMSRYENQKLIRKFYLESIGLQIFVNQLLQFEDDLLNDSDRTILRVNELNRVEELSTYILENIDKELSVASLSTLAGLNPNKLQLAFKYIFSKTVNEYVTTTRLEMSLKLLEDKNLNVSEVVLRIGFKSYSYFSKIFKQKYMVSPSTYRELKLKS